MNWKTYILKDTYYILIEVFRAKQTQDKIEQKQIYISFNLVFVYGVGSKNVYNL